MPTVALIGGTHIHTPGFVQKMAEAEDITVKYVFDDDADTAKRRQEVCGGRIIDTIDPALEDNGVEAAVICSETVKHKALVERCAAAGKHLFVEKPLGMGAEDAYAMAEAIEKAGVKFQTGFFNRGRPPVRFIRDAVQSGKLGKVTRIRVSNCHHGAIGGWFDTEWRWMADLEQAGCGAFGDLGAHVLDLMLWIMDGDAVEGCTGVIGKALDKYGCDEFGEGLVRFRSGAAGVVAGGWVDRANPNFLELSATEGHAAIGIHGFLLASPNFDDADGHHPYELSEEAWPHAFDMFLDALRGKDVPLVGAREAAYRSAVMEAIYQGVEQQKWIAPRAK